MRSLSRVITAIILTIGFNLLFALEPKEVLIVYFVILNYLICCDIVRPYDLLVDGQAAQEDKDTKNL